MTGTDKIKQLQEEIKSLRNLVNTISQQATTNFVAVNDRIDALEKRFPPTSDQTPHKNP